MIFLEVLCPMPQIMQANKILRALKSAAFVPILLTSLTHHTCAAAPTCDPCLWLKTQVINPCLCRTACAQSFCKAEPLVLCRRCAGAGCKEGSNWPPRPADVCRAPWRWGPPAEPRGECELTPSAGFRAAHWRTWVAPGSAHGRGPLANHP